MAQNTDVVLDELRYTRADYTALRAHCLKIPVARIAELYYSEDSPQVEQGLERFLLAMRDDLVERAIAHNPAFAEILKDARRDGAVTNRALEILVRAADVPPAVPSPNQPVSQWFRPRTVAALRQEGVKTLANLITLVNRRGPGWWRPIPRIGARRALVILTWLRAHEATLGEVSTANYSIVSLAPSLILDPACPDQMAPLGRFALPPGLDGSIGINRGSQFCFIQARNDLQAVECYLARYEDQPHTLRAYRKELERFILWAILVAGKPMSSLLVDDCEAYKRFLRSPAPAFTGERAGRFTQRWRPFAKDPLTPRSQKQAVLILRAAFEYLARVRYLGGNPWVVVKDPRVVEEVHAMQIEKALTDELWLAVTDRLALRGQVFENAQDRAALATILLLGDSGLRREEAAGAMRSNLKPSRWEADVWTLRVTGKRGKKRDVPVSGRTIDALRAHWVDLGLDFDASEMGTSAGAEPYYPLLCPVVVPRHAAALARHESGMANDTVNGYTADGLYRLVRTALGRVKVDLLEAGISPADFAQLEITSPHAFRHTFGTLAVAHGMPQDVVQGVLGHASGTTTSIYVRAKDKRIAEEAGKYFSKNLPDDEA